MILTIYTATTMIIIAYLLGSIPSAVWIGKKYYGIDIREHGSKNAGTTNMLRVLGLLNIDNFRRVVILRAVPL